MTIEVIAPGMPARLLERVVCVRVPDDTPPLLDICRCACCGGLRKVSLHGGQYTAVEDSKRLGTER